MKPVLCWPIMPRYGAYFVMWLIDPFLQLKQKWVVNLLNRVSIEMLANTIKVIEQSRQFRMEFEIWQLKHFLFEQRKCERYVLWCKKPKHN